MQRRTLKLKFCITAAIAIAAVAYIVPGKFSHHASIGPSEKKFGLDSLNDGRVTWDGSTFHGTGETYDFLEQLDSNILRSLLVNTPDSIVKLQEMRSRWIDLCIENSKPDDMDKFSLSKVVDSICQEDTWVAVVPDDYSPADGPALECVAEADQELIISELELRRLWDSLKVQTAKNLDAVSLLLSPVTAPLISAGVVPFSSFSSASALGRADSVAAGAVSDAESSSASLSSSSSNVLRLGKALNAEFSVEDALLLLEDEDSFGIFTPESDFAGSSESGSQGSTGIAQFDMSEYATSEAVDSEFWDRDAALEEEEEEAELVVTAQELERLWTARQEADPWSARAASTSSPFDTEEALLLLAGGVDGLVNDAAVDDLYPADALKGGMHTLVESETDGETKRESERELEAGDYRQLEYVPAPDNSMAAEEFERLTSLGTSCPTPRARALHYAVSRAATATASAAASKAFTTADGHSSEMFAGVGRDRDMGRDMDDLEMALLEADARESASEIYTKNLYLTALTELDTADTSVDAISQRLIAQAAAAAASASGSSPSTSSSTSVQDVVRRLNRDLDDTTYFRPAWQKERDFLSPDIDTQIFEGDIMFSNTYLTQRIPANWDDPEKDEMSENYLACGTMAMPGEPETDFDVKMPIWEEAQLPVGPQFVEDPEEMLEVPSPQYVEQEYKDRILARTKQGAIRKLVELAKSFIIDPETVQIGNDGRLRIGVGRKAKKTNPKSGADLYISSVYAPPEMGEFTDRAVKELPSRPPSSSLSGATTPEGGTGAGVEEEEEKQSTKSSGESFSVEAWREKSATDYDMYLLTTYDSHDLENDPIVRQQIRRPPAANTADGESHRTSKSGARDSADERFGLLCSDNVASDPFASVAGAAAVVEGGIAGDAGYEGESSMLDAFFDSFAEQDSAGDGAAREGGGGMAVAGAGLGSDAAGKAGDSDGTEVAKVGEGGKLTTSSSASGGVRVGDGSADDLIYEPDELAHLQAMETAQVSSTREVAMEEYEDSTVGLEEEGPPRRSLKWRTPRAWLRRPGFANHVGYEIWGNYNPAAFEVIDDHVWDDDAYTLQSVHYLNSITDLYLTDHAEANKHIDERKYWERVLVSQYKSNAKAAAAAAATATTETGVEAGAEKGGKGKASRGEKNAKKDEAVAAVTAAADQARSAAETKQTAATMTVDGLPVIEGIVGMKSLPDDNGDPLPDEYRERVPSFYTPDSDRGVLYNDEVVEMKGKMVLHAYQSPPSIAFENDSFAYNEEMDTMNQIGSCRDQYDWTPTLPTVDQVRELPTGAVDMHRGVEIATAAMGISLNSPQVEEAELDAKVVLRILPLIFFANHVANLKSTKGNVLIFEYGGVMRHLPGIRAAMLSVAKQCIPELEDLRLETRRKADKFDY